jgi:hypothetical protein
MSKSGLQLFRSLRPASRPPQLSQSASFDPSFQVRHNANDNGLATSRLDRVILYAIVSPQLSRVRGNGPGAVIRSMYWF